MGKMIRGNPGPSRAIPTVRSTKTTAKRKDKRKADAETALIPAPRPGADDYTLSYNEDCKEPGWAVRTIWIKEGDKEFRNMVNWSRIAVRDVLAKTMAVFQDDLYTECVKDLPLYVIQLTKEYAMMHDGKPITGVYYYQAKVITAPDLGFRTERISLKFKGALGSFLKQVLQIGRTLVILGGTFDTCENTLHFDTRLTHKKEFISLPVKLFQILEGEGPDDIFRPFDVHFPTKDYQLLYQTKSDCALLKVTEAPLDRKHKWKPVETRKKGRTDLKSS